ncbi:MAG: PQQ-like beta-propeller repeat protein [Pirellulales bacterium]|nr:PQQ-like beta-propeller repeat protein [Pirellulales bacterium]
MKARLVRLFLLALLLVLLHTEHASADHWPQMRGPHGTCATEAHDLPVEFGKEKNLLWRVEMPGHSAATPAVWGDYIFTVTPEGEEVYLVALDLAGQERWRRKVGTGNRKLGFNGKNNFATPSPATDGEHVWLLVGTGELHCFDMDGAPVWSVNLNDLFGKYDTLFGFGFTPLLWQDSLFVPYLHQGTSLVAALDKRTGEVRWKTGRTTDAKDESKDAYSSPCILTYPDRAEVVICGADLANAYDAATGEEIWRHGDINPTDNNTLRIVVSPVTDGQRIYVSSAKRGPVHAIKPGGSGDVTATHHLWTRTEDTPDVPTPAVADGLFYMLRENGVLSVLDAATGEQCYSERVASRAGAFSPSPVVADGKVYLASEGGILAVVAAGRTFDKLAENDLGEMMMATPAIVGDRIYVRTEKALYCFQKQ